MKKSLKSLLNCLLSGFQKYHFWEQISNRCSGINKPRRDTCDTALKSWRSIFFDEKVFYPPQKFLPPFWTHNDKFMCQKSLKMFSASCVYSNETSITNLRIRILSKDLLPKISITIKSCGVDVLWKVRKIILSIEVSFE